MTGLELLVKQLDEKTEQLKESVVIGNLDHVQYQRLCGEIRGLLLAKGYVLDLRDKLENTDE
mgnify:FL=1|jgi:uncharacterized protein YaaR (DUF327 family)